MTMRVKMLTDAPGSPDGVTVNEYTKGEVYEVSNALAAAFVEFDLAVVTEDETAPVAEPEPEVDVDIEDPALKKEDGPKADKKAAGPDENK